MATTRDARPISEVITGHGHYRTLKAYGVIALAITAADVGTINNIVNMFTVPKGFTLIGQHIDVTQLDTGGSLTLDIGDTTTANRLLAASTIGQSAESESNVTLPAGALGFKYTADTIVSLKAHAAATTGAAGTVTCLLYGYIDA